MGKLKEQYLNLTPPALAAILVAGMAIAGFIMYTRYFTPELRKVDAARKQYESINNAYTVQMEKLKVIDANPLDDDAVEIKPEHLQWLAERRNEITAGSGSSGLVNLIKSTARSTGGRDVEAELGAASAIYLRTGADNAEYRVRKQPLTLRFQSDYNGVSNFLFQLKAMGRLVELVKIEMNSDGRRNGLSAVVTMNLFFAEETAGGTKL